MLERHWHVACRSRDLRARPLGVTLLGHPVVLFRDANGIAAALEDRCAHRNAPLSMGRVEQGCLQCPYHGWSYRRDGAIASIPAAGGACAGGSAAVASHPCVEQDGYVWVAPADAAATPAPIPFAHLGEPGWTSFRMRTRFRAPVEACLENFLDCPHAAFVHRGWFRSPRARRLHAIVRTLPDGAEAEYFGEPREASLVWWLLAPKATSMRHTDRFIAPSTSRVDYLFSDGSAYVITSACTPVGDALTEVHTVISFRFGRIGALVRLFFEPLSRVIIEQDRRMLDRVQANVERFGAPRQRIVATDLLLPHIQRWRRALARGEAPAPVPEQHVELSL